MSNDKPSQKIYIYVSPLLQDVDDLHIWFNTGIYEMHPRMQLHLFLCGCLLCLREYE